MFDVCRACVFNPVKRDKNSDFYYILFPKITLMKLQQNIIFYPIKYI